MFIAKQKTSSGYQLFDRGNNIYQICGPMGSFTGKLDDVMGYAYYDMGFELDELEKAVIEMEASFMDAAEFGVLKRFMYPFDTEEKNAKSTRH